MDNQGRCPHCGYKGKQAGTIVDATCHAGRVEDRGWVDDVLWLFRWFGICRWPVVEEIAETPLWALVRARGGAVIGVILRPDRTAAMSAFSLLAADLGFTHDESMRLFQQGLPALRGDETLDACQVLT